MNKFKIKKMAPNHSFLLQSLKEVTTAQFEDIIMFVSLLDNLNTSNLPSFAYISLHGLITRLTGCASPLPSVQSGGHPFDKIASIIESLENRTFLKLPVPERISSAYFANVLYRYVRYTMPLHLKIICDQLVDLVKLDGGNRVYIQDAARFEYGYDVFADFKARYQQELTVEFIVNFRKLYEPSA